MGLQWVVRPALTEDADAVRETWTRSIREVCLLDHRGDEAVIHKWCANKTADNRSEWFREADALWRVASDERRGILGVACLHLSGEVRACYVRPDALRERIGSALLACLENEARARGLEQLVLHSTETALAFYRGAGYVREGEPVLHFGVVRAYPMKKAL